MKTHEKLDFLMKVTNVSNSRLGRSISFDASYISRIRSGKRGLPKGQPFIEPVAAFFSKTAVEDYQKKALAEVLCPGREWPEKSEEAEALLTEWLLRSDSAADDPIGRILTGLSSMPKTAPSMPEIDAVQTVGSAPGTSFYYGNEGKRRAVELFLSEACAMDHPCRLLLCSNEEFDWLYEDKNFVRRWAALMMRLMTKGGHIQIIHSINRGANDMLVALQKWMPLYMSGAIEPYYYPKIRDRVYRRTIFIVEGCSAVVSSSIENNTAGALNMLLHDKNAVEALEGEYKNYFALCKPLMQVFNMRNREFFSGLLHNFEESSEELIMALPVPTFATMPRSVAETMSQRCGNKWMLRRCEEGLRRFEKQLERGQTVTDILNLPPPEQVREGRLMFPMCDLFDRPGLYYTAEEFKAHLISTAEYLKKYEKYNVVLAKDIPQNEIIYVKEDLGVIVVKAETPSVAFGITEQRMTSAFWDYLTRIAEDGANRKKTLKELENYIEKL